MHIPSQIEYMLKKLTAAGYEAYLVGGCVRDFLLGNIPQDYDITTSAHPEETTAVFATDKVIPTGIVHGTVTVLHDGFSAEITTYRTETAYTDGRHPDKVEFTRRIEDDLCRRDFTVNAMAMSPEGAIIDFYGGRSDLERGIIRTVGTAEERFFEDALRILRAFRFAAKLDFNIEQGTLKAAIGLGNRLSLVSRERIGAELCKLLCGKATGRVLEKMFAGGIFDRILEAPEINTKAFNDIDLLPCRADIRLAALLLYDARVNTHVASLKMSGEFFDTVTRICKARLPDSLQKPKLRRAIANYGTAALDRALIEGRTELYNALCEIQKGENCFSVRDLKISGSEVSEITGACGRDIGIALEKLLIAVFDEKVKNDKRELTEFLKKVDNT